MVVNQHASTSAGIAELGDPAKVQTWERVVLGRLLLASNAEDFVGNLRPQDFSTAAHEAIYAAIQVYAGRADGQVAVLAELIGDRRVASVGDPATYLSKCSSQAHVAVGDFSWWAGLVRQAAEFRNAQRCVEKARLALDSGDLDAIRVAFDQAAVGLGQPAGEAGGAKVRLRSAGSFQMKGVRWLYQGRIPAGMMTLLAGREGIGKSTVSLDIAAHVTKGTLAGRYEGNPRNVILCATEDSWEHTIIPRLRAVGADLDRVFHIAVQDERGGFRAISAPGDIRAIEQAIGEVEPALMVIDPLMSVIDGRIDTHVQQQVQQGLEPLIHLCERAAMAVVGLIHVNKSTTVDALNSIMGSKAFTSLPRSVLYCIADPEEDGSYLMTHEKCNLGPKAPSLRYRLSSVRFELDPHEVDDGDQPFILTSRVVWGGEDERRASEVMAEINAGRNLGDLRKALREYIDSKPHRIVAAELVGEFEDVTVTRANIDQTLKRMVRKGEIDHPARGFYQSMKLARPS